MIILTLLSFASYFHSNFRKVTTMHLYKITTRFLGKDLNKFATLTYLVAENEDGVYDHINEKHMGNDWSESVNMTREVIIAVKGDFKSDYMGEFYDQKFGWEDLGEVSVEDIANLKRLKILSE
jgi:hypothetical protein